MRNSHLIIYPENQGIQTDKYSKALPAFIEEIPEPQRSMSTLSVPNVDNVVLLFETPKKRSRNQLHGFSMPTMQSPITGNILVAIETGKINTAKDITANNFRDLTEEEHDIIKRWILKFGQWWTPSQIQEFNTLGEERGALTPESLSAIQKKEIK